MYADVAGDDHLQPRESPMPAFGSMPKSKARSGLATFIMIFSGAGGMRTEVGGGASKGRAPA